MNVQESSRTTTTTARSAMTLVELLVAVGISGILFAAVASLSLYTARSYAAMGNYADLDRASQNALDRMSRAIRQTKELTYYSTNILIFRKLNSSNYLYFWYVPSSKEVYTYDTSVGVVQTLLKQCDFLTFHISQRNPSNNFEFYPVMPNRPDLAKLIDVSWRCSRTIFGNKLNTESVQTAKIVMRN